MSLCGSLHACCLALRHKVAMCHTAAEIFVNSLVAMQLSLFLWVIILIYVIVCCVALFIYFLLYSFISDFEPLNC